MNDSLPVPVRKKIDLRPYDGVLWRRAVAYFLDLLFAALLFAPLALLLFLGGFVTFGLLWGPLPFLWLATNIIYYSLLVGGSRGSTWGQRLMGLEARTNEGQTPVLFQALLQIVLFYVSVTVTYGLILLAGLFNPKGQLVHDFFSGIVIRKVV
jgi:uncharacterized RDD family membrane protein YckC